MSFYQMGNNAQIEGLSEIYEKYFGQKTDGTFVEIGAYDGYEWSNTWGLMILGWKGIAVEPNPNTFQQLIGNCTDKIICCNAAIGKDSVCKLRLSGGISTTSEEQSNIYKECDWFSGNEQVVEVPMVTLDALLETFEMKEEFEVLVVDTEGTELEVLETFDIDKWKPKMVIVEAHELHPTKGFNRHATEINKYFEKHNYTKIYCDIINNIYVRN
jgi:FkbM family methyltransferase